MSEAQKTCCWSGCEEAGTHPAPRRRQMPVSFNDPFAVADDVPVERDYYCLEHIREFNKNWDFFNGMSDEEVEAFQKDAVTGHRKTQKIQPHIVADGYRRAAAFRTGTPFTSAKPAIPTRAASREEREALAVLGLDFPASADAIKQRYRELVKQHHPDRGSAENDEMIKSINQAYTMLQAGCI